MYLVTYGSIVSLYTCEVECETGTGCQLRFPSAGRVNRNQMEDWLRENYHRDAILVSYESRFNSYHRYYDKDGNYQEA